MNGTFEIIENKSDVHKFRAMVSFNGKAAAYHEVDVDSIGGIIHEKQGKLDELNKHPEVNADELESVRESLELYEQWLGSPAKFVNAQLQKTADEDAAHAQAEAPRYEVSHDGKLVE